MDGDDFQIEISTSVSNIVTPKTRLSFTEIFKTPDKVSNNTKIRKCAINSRAFALKKNVFLEKDKIEAKPRKKDKTTRQKINIGCWYCNI